LLSSTSPPFDTSGAAAGEFDQFLEDLLLQPMQNQAMHTSPNFVTTPQSAALTPQALHESTGVAGDNWPPYSKSVFPRQYPTPIVSSSQPCKFIDFSTIPNLDPTMLKPPTPPSPADIIAQSEAAAKQAKLEQYCAHLEAAMQLERELTTV